MAKPPTRRVAATRLAAVPARPAPVAATALRGRRVVPGAATDEPPPRPVAARVAPPAGAATAGTGPAFTRHGLAGAAALGLGVTVLILNFVLPWVAMNVPAGASVPPTGADFRFEWRQLDRGEFEDIATSDYYKSLLSWPLIGTIGLATTGLALVILDLVPMPSLARRVAQAVAVAAAGFFALLVAIVGSRWLGIYFSSLWSEGPARLHLHVVPYLNLALGLAGIVTAALLFRASLGTFMAGPPRGRFGRAGTLVPGLSVTILVAALVLLPVLPVVSADSTRGTLFLFGDGTLSDAAQQDSGKTRDVAKEYVLARTMLWVALAIAAIALPLGLLERTGHQPQVWGGLAQLYALTLVPVVIGVVFTILFYVHIPDMPIGGADKVSYAYNYFLPLAWAAQLGVFGLYVLRILLPAVRRSPARAGVAAPAATSGQP